MVGQHLGLRTRIFLLMSFGIFTIYKGEEILNRSTKANPHYRSISRHQHDNPDPDVIRITGSLKEEYLRYNLAINVTSHGTIDPRTKVLTERASRYLADNNWWLNGGCDCEAPVYKYITNQLSKVVRTLQPTGRIVPIKEYWSEVYVSRTVVSLGLQGGASLNHHDNDGRITLLTQCSPGRRHMLPYIFDNWPGPINLAIYAKNKEFERILKFVSDLMITTKRSNIIIHIVISTGDVYPVNWLRNLVLRNSTSEYVFNIDVDFIPSKGLMDELNRHLTGLNQLSANRTLLLVPALEMYDSTVKELPLTKPELLPLVKSNKAGEFHPTAAGQSLWLVDKWVSTETSYVLPRPGSCDNPSEPYLVVKRTLSPFYPETLLERGKNKVAFYVELCAKEYTFLVIKEGFLFHKWHDLSTRATKKVDACVRHSYHAFKKLLGKSIEKPHLFDPIISWSLQGFYNGIFCMVFDYFICFLLLSPFILATIYLIHTMRICQLFT